MFYADNSLLTQYALQWLILAEVFSKADGASAVQQPVIESPAI